MPSKYDWKNERMGLTMIGASLLVIGLIIALMFHYQRTTREQAINAQGVSLARVLSEMEYSQLVPAPGRRGILHAIGYRQDDADFAYAAIVNTSGALLAEVSSPGVIVPKVQPPAEPASWLGTRTLSLGKNEVIEFHAPVFEDGILSGHLRLGYLKPSFGPSYEQLPFLATLALPIFLLTPLFYLLIRREVKPLRQANGKIEDLLKEGSFQKVDISASGELGEFVRNFNGFIELTSSRIQELESDQNRLLTSTKLLAYKKSRVEGILEAFPETVLVMDESGIVNFANGKTRTLLGMPTGEIMGRKAEEWCEQPEILAYLSHCTGGGAGRYATQSVEFSPVNAPEKTISLTAYPLFSPKDATAVFGSLLVFRDVTLEMLAKRSRGEFVAHVAHELKTPLNTLALYSESLQGESGESEEFRVEATNVIADEVERLSELINNLLSITKIEMGSLGIERKRVRLRDLLEDVFQTISRTADSQEIKFELDLPHDLSAVSVDKELLRIAINNLLTNAVKYNRPGGTVTLSAEETDQTIWISVSDTGIGIAPEERDRIFEKFYRSESGEVRERTGHGLGLSLANDIVKLHNGSLSVESKLDAGSEFVIGLWKESNAMQQAI